MKVIWNFKTKDLREKRITAFKVLRVLNGQTTLIQGKTFIDASEEHAEFTVEDAVAEGTTPSYYALPISVMGTEGKGYAVNYDENSVEILLALPQLLSPKTKGNTSIISWQFDPEEEQYIKGFLVTRKNQTTQDTLSVTLAPNVREFSDSTRTQSGQYNYVVSLLKKDGSIQQGATLTILYTYTQAVAIPQNLQGSFENTIQLHWDYANTTIRKGIRFRVYLAKPYEELLAYDARIPETNTTSAAIEVNELETGYWQFAVSAIDSSGVESDKSEPITVLVPSTSIPQVVNATFKKLPQGASIDWTYYSDNVPDLAGFRIYHNDLLVADEDELGADRRKWTTSTLAEGKNIFRIEAITTSGVLSPPIQGLIKNANDN